jgi:hypothetical protein
MSREFTVADWAARCEERARVRAREARRFDQELLNMKLRMKHAQMVMSTRGYLRAGREKQRRMRAELFTAPLRRWL